MLDAILSGCPFLVPNGTRGIALGAVSLGAGSETYPDPAAVLPSRLEQPKRKEGCASEDGQAPWIELPSEEAIRSKMSPGHP
jgi:hypothetical protein